MAEHKPPRPQRMPARPDAQDSQTAARLSRRDPQLLQRLPPAMVPREGAMDAVAFRGMLLVAYTAAYSTVVVARGTDLGTMDLVPAPAHLRDQLIGAVAFRPRDCGLTIAFGGRVAIYPGWSEQDAALRWTEDDCFWLTDDNGETVDHGWVSSLTFCRSSHRLAVVGSDVSVWESDGASDASWRRIMHVNGPDLTLGQTPGTRLFDLGGISPDGELVASAARQADVVRVWRVESSSWSSRVQDSSKARNMDIETVAGIEVSSVRTLRRNMSEAGKLLSSPPVTNLDQPSLPFAELEVGRSGVSSLSWKWRGGGQPVLVTSDFDGVLRLWAKIPRVTSHRPSGWMEEIARSPHMLGTQRSSSAFVHWGGGGGVAIDEADAAATAALYPFLVEGSVQKPSRTNHWIASASGGRLQAWRSRGLDDRPRAMYARLEPGAENQLDRTFGHPTVDESSNWERSASLLSGRIVAVKSLAPEPLSSSSSQTSDLVKSYAISNNERRIRSPEPPDPPNLMVSFVSALEGSRPCLARYDLCPTSGSLAVCRSRVGAGPRSHVVEIQGSAGCAESTRAGLMIASRGCDGDVSLWRIDASSRFSPLHLFAQLPGPHSAVALSPVSFRAAGQHVYLVAASSVSSLLTVYRLPLGIGCRTRARSDRVTFPEKVASCVELKRITSMELVRCHGSLLDEIILVGILGDDGKLGCWKLTVPVDGAAASLKRVILTIDCASPESISALVASDSGIDDDALLVLGSRKGLVHVTRVRTYPGGDKVVVEEQRTLGKGTSGAGGVVAVTIGRLGLRIAAVREDGSLTIWERNPTSGKWKREFHRVVIRLLDRNIHNHQSLKSMSFGSDPMGDVYLALSCPAASDGDAIYLFVKRKGLSWSELSLFGSSENRYSSHVRLFRFKPCLFIGAGILVTSDGPCMLSYSSLSGPRISTSANRIYSRDKILSAIIHTGGSVWQTMDLLHWLREALESVDPLKPGSWIRPPPLEILLGRNSSTALPLPPSELDGVIERFKSTTLGGLSSRNRHEVICLLRAASEIGAMLPSMDSHGAAFALAAVSHLMDTASRAALASAVVAEALHSTSKDALVDSLIRPPSGTSLSETMWEQCRRLGAGFWIDSGQHAKTLAERVARHTFAHSKQDPDTTALWYIVLGRRTALSALYRAKNNKKMYDFLIRDFRMEENRVAAMKNAYVLVSKHRFELAAAFLALAGDAYGCGHLIRTRLRDPQLALLCVRLLGDFGELRDMFSVGEQVESALRKTLGDILVDAERSCDHHTASICLWLLGRAEQSLQAAADKFDVEFPGPDQEESAGEDLETIMTLGHVLAISSRPSLKGLSRTAKTLRSCRLKAASTLAAEGSPISALSILFDLLDSEPDKEGLIMQKCVEATETLLKLRAISLGRSFRGSGAHFYSSLLQDLEFLCLKTPLETHSILRSCERSAVELSLFDEADAATLLALAAFGLQSKHIERNLLMLERSTRSKIDAVSDSTILSSLEEALIVSSVHAFQIAEATLFDASCGGSKLFDVPLGFCEKLLTSLRGSKSSPIEAQWVVERMNGHLRRGMLVLQLCVAFMDGDWVSLAGLIMTLLGGSNSPSRGYPSGSELENPVSDEGDLAWPDVDNVENLRSLASSPAIRRHESQTIRSGIRRSLTQDQFSHLSPTGTPHLGEDINLDWMDQELISPVRLNFDSATSSCGPEPLKHRDPRLDHALGCALFSSAASFVARVVQEELEQIRWSRPDFRILDAVERLEATAADALLGWMPLRPFGVRQRREMKSRDLFVASSRAHGRLWKLFATVGEFAPLLSESATVAAAAKAFESTVPAKRSRSPATVHGDSYPVRFSTSSSGPWSGLGRHLVIYRAPGELVRGLAISASDPPVLTIATPKGVHEIIPSSYICSPSLTTSFENASDLGRRVDIQRIEEQTSNRFIALGAGDGSKVHSSVWKHDVGASALASHPYKRRYASGGSDGVVRLWAYSEPQDLGELRLKHGPGRVASLAFSAYAEGLIAVFVTGQVALWSDPEHSASLKSMRNHQTIHAFGGRRASGAVFVDERQVIAVVGDPGGVSSAGAHGIGHSLRIFDLRERTATQRATWTSRVHAGAEARCLAMMEDRVRIATGGTDGTMSIVDIRARACIAEQLPAHDDEISCMSVESTRGRALVTGCSSGTVKLWDARTLLPLDTIHGAHAPTRHFWTGAGLGGIVGTHGVKSLCLTDRTLISAGGDGLVKIWGPGWGDFDHTIL
mmetsp:Transcript_6564/g.13234  ORF Transcript_6564/g.13234 Transcript_6564/m.13234 type:complete len:2240 (-) Transcript_6564:254-6973(-)